MSVSSIPVDADHRFSHAEILRVLFGILLCILLAAIDQTVVVPAVPAIATDLNGFSHLSWIVSAYLLTTTAATPIYGRLSDMYGRRKLLLFALALFTVTSAMCAMAQTLGQLIAFRALQGLGGGGLLALAQAAVADVVSPRERGRYQGYMASVWGVASVAGPVLGGWVSDAFSWRWIFWMNLPLGVLAIVLCDRALRLLPVRNQPARIDWLGVLLLTGAVTAFLLVLSWGGAEYPWFSPPVVGIGLLGAALTAGLVMQELAVRDPLLPPRLFANAVFVRGAGVGFFASLGLLGATFLLPLHFQLIGGANAARSGLLIAPFLGISCIGAFVAGQWARRMGRTKAVLMLGLAIACGGFLLLTLLDPETPDWLEVAATLPLGAGIGMTLPTSLVIVQNAAERRDVGVATGSLLLLRSMGGAFGSTLVGALIAERFTALMQQYGLNRHTDLSALRGGAVASLDPVTRQATGLALTGGFDLAFLVCAVLMAVAVVVARGMQDLQLRSSAASEAPTLGH